MLNKVPQVTIFFWIIKVLATTVGETAADFLSTTLNLGLIVTSYVMSGLFVVVLIVQLTRKRYIPALYWAVVVLISVVGTLVSDTLVDKLGVGLRTSTAIFAVCLGVVFSTWWLRERNLSVHAINTTRRELFYWAAILFTFALGTSGGDLVAETFGVGYALSVVLFAALIGLTALAYYAFKVGGVLAFWIAYILTRPLGASTGDLLSQSVKDGGLGLGTTSTSAVFLVVIIGLVTYLTMTHADDLAKKSAVASSA
jgi:uncharacterized membrane-anchored protein